MTRQLYNLTNIRELLTQGFDDRQLRRLCYDMPDFRPVYDELARTTGKADIIDALLEYAERQLLIDTLLALVKDQNPSRYDHHAPYYLDDPTPALQKQISDLAKRLAVITSPTSLTREDQYLVAYHWQELGGKDSLRGFDLAHRDLRGVDLVGVDLRAATLESVGLIAADLRQADLRGAHLFEAYLRAANLSGANLSGAVLRQADLRTANLSAANLSGADLEQAKLSGANLTEANLSGANLLFASLSGANLSAANFTEAYLDRYQLVDALTLKGATLGDGKVYERMTISRLALRFLRM